MLPITGEVSTNSTHNAPPPVPSAIEQIRHATLVENSSVAYEVILDSIIQHFDKLTNPERADAVVLFIKCQKQENELSISLQEMLTAFQTIKDHGHATKDTIAFINNLQYNFNIDNFLNNAIKRHNQKHPDHPFSIKKDWLYVVTYQAKEVLEVLDRIGCHFHRINVGANHDECMPSIQFMDVLIAITSKFERNVNSTSLHTIMKQLASRLRDIDDKKHLSVYCETLNLDKAMADAARRYENNSNNALQIKLDFNPFATMSPGLWGGISGEHLTWTQWARLSRTCKPLNLEFSKKINTRLSRLGQLRIANALDQRAATINAFKEPANRILSEILINRKGIHHIQQTLKINCGPNMLIDIKQGRLSLADAENRLKVPMTALRTQLQYLSDEQFLVIKKYLVDKLFDETTLTQSSPESITKFANLLLNGAAMWLDEIVLDSNQPVQFGELEHLVDQNIFDWATKKQEILMLTTAKIVHRIQLLTLTEKNVSVLCIIAPHLLTNEIKLHRVLTLTDDEKEFLCDPRMRLITRHPGVPVFFKHDGYLDFLNQNKEKLATLIERKINQLNTRHLDKMYIVSLRLICNTTMYALVQSNKIMIDEVTSFTSDQQVYLRDHAEVLLPLLNHTDKEPQQYTLSKLVAFVDNEINRTALSQLAQLIKDNKMPVETLFELSDESKKSLCESGSLKQFFNSTHLIKVTEFFNLSEQQQKFIEKFWGVLLPKMNEAELAFGHLKKSTSADLNVFETKGIDAYVTHVRQKYPTENCVIS